MATHQPGPPVAPGTTAMRVVGGPAAAAPAPPAVGRMAPAPIAHQPAAQIEDKAAQELRHQLNRATAHNFAEYRDYFDSLDMDEVVKWLPVDVAEHFLKTIGLGAFSQTFIEHKISGRTLLGLSKQDLIAMKILAIGDRVLISNAVKYLAKIQVRKERDRIVWEGATPSGGIAYYETCLDCVLYKLFPCACALSRWRLTPTGIRERRDPPPCNLCCLETVNDYKDIRFLKDVDSRWEFQCLCFCKRRSMMLLFDHDQTVGDADEIHISHPDATEELTDEIQALWAEARLVAD
eukprot:CAMPEP_0182926098 /NCGR_PEP_ID=MMETSP0105_2-20130417/10823_1 /TAXON_ID=81532 ORGANISM="Acanthoeca-like sp., Strain 10tr" /NCGR_SAMPLE_ID=MMETSP0105_2 /ASSEMBLY_ACC=CAM_ASM_000205 /LENGTH=291 /DNA_ID=CAMNT_0025063971 /DNA_START=15 /DNA_END=890 /DNA_ORIENTATION=+